MKKIFLCFFLLTFFISNSQAQKIKVPDPGLNLLFGKWQFVSSSGGFTGKGMDWSPKNNIRIEYKKNGCYKRTEKGKTKATDKFQFLEGKSITNSESAYLIDYAKNNDQSFSIQGDTLFLTDEMHDGYNYVFIRK